MRVAAGTRIGRYIVERLLGVGGMGEVYLARDEQLDRPVALKLLPEALRRDEEFQRRLHSEARAASALNHPHILTVHEIGAADGEHFIATEFVDGVTLRQRIGRIALVDAIRIIEKIAEALAAAEFAGILHRDIKPDNIMIRSDGYVKLLDFGLARRGDASADLHDTSSRAVRGTVHYMSPEQLRGIDLDSRSDVWSLGVVLSELIAARRPFDGETVTEVITAIIAGEGVLPGGPPALQAIVRRALQKDRKDRFQSMTEMRDALHSLRRELESGSIEATILSPHDERTAEFDATPLPTPFPRASRRASNLPILLTPLLGREEEVESVKQLLARDECRLVTLTGPGGTGKTRLALQIALEVVALFRGGVFFIPLAAVHDPALVPEAIANALGIGEDAGRSFIETLERDLAADEMLLVIDNFEQLVEGSNVLARLLESAPGVKVLATSQAPLRLRGEIEYAVQPLALPDRREASAELLSGNPSVALFVQRAQAIDGRFALTSNNAADVAAICLRLDGLPLAIELAAARVRSMSPKQILARLDDRLKLLSGGSRDLPARQQTMHAAISWGFNLLGEEEKALLARLSLFQGGIPLRGAEAIGEAAPRLDVQRALESLVERSFIRRDDNEEKEPRFGLLGTIRDFGSEQLRARGEESPMRDEHAAFFLGVAEEAEASLRGDGQREAIAILESEHENILEAMRWVISSRADARALRFAGAMWWFWYLRGHYSLGRRWIEAALTQSPSSVDPHVSARAHLGAGVLAFLQCDYDHAASRLEKAAAMARQMDDRPTYARALQFRGGIARERGDYARALELHHRALEHFREMNDRSGIARSLNYIGFANWLSGDAAAAIPVSKEALQIFGELGDSEGVAWSRINLAAAATYSGADDEAMVIAKDALGESRPAGFKEGVAWSLNLLGIISRRRGLRDRAEGFLRQSFSLHWELGDRWRTASVLEALMGLRLDADDQAGAAMLFDAASRLRESIGTPVPMAEKSAFDADRNRIVAPSKTAAMSVHEAMAAVFER